jgi:two-component sensor histidine kinase
VDETIDRVLIVPHLRKLCEELGGILGCEIGIAGADHVSVPKRQILAIGLIANELIANARKHAAGPISVTFRSVSDDSHELCVLDEGQGLPDSFAAGASAGLGIGLKVVTALIGQLGGKVSAGPNPSGRGACIAMTFPAT